MTTKARKTKTPEAILTTWIAAQDDSYEMSRAAEEDWQAGAETYIDIVETFDGETVITHCERFYVGERFIVVCWDDNGNVTYGGM